MHSRQSVHDLIQQGWESDLPDRVLSMLAGFDGKPITTRLEKVLESKMPGQGWRIIRHHGWTSLQNEAYWRTSGSSENGIDLMLAYSETSVVLDLAWVKAKNIAYFEARTNRNHARMEAMNSSDTLDRAARLMNYAAETIARLHSIESEMDRTMGYGTVLDPDRYELQRACGWMDAGGNRILSDKYKAAK